MHYMLEELCKKKYRFKFSVCKDNGSDKNCVSVENPLRRASINLLFVLSFQCIFNFTVEKETWMHACMCVWVTVWIRLSAASPETDMDNKARFK